VSRVTIDYSFDDTPGGRSPVRASLATAGDTLAKSVAALVTAIVAALPWLIVGAERRAAGLAARLWWAGRLSRRQCRPTQRFHRK